METLPGDIVEEILLRVPDIPDLFHRAVTCKRLRLLIAGPFFLRRSWPEGVRDPSSLLGFFARPPPREYRTAGIIPTPLPSFTPVPWSPMGRYQSFLREALAYGTVPLTSCRGLLLAHITPHYRPDNALKRNISLAVFHLFASTSCQLPLLKCNGHFRMVGYTMLTGAECCSSEQRRPVSSIYSACFKVLIISVDRDEPRYNIHMFTSYEWRCFDPVEHGIYVVPQQFNAVVCQGMARWLFRDMSNFYTLNVCARTVQMSLTKLPVTPNVLSLRFYSALLNVTNDGRLSLLGLYRGCNWLQIWTRHGDNK